MFADDFFDYRPLILGLVLDLDHHHNLRRVKDALVGFMRTLEADTEDKVYVHHPARLAYDGLLGESIARVANWAEQVEPGVSPLLQTQALVRLYSDEERRHLCLVTDRLPTSHLGLRSHHDARQVCRDVARHGGDLSVVVLGIGPVGDYEATVGPYPFASFHRLAPDEITPDRIGGFFHA